MDQFSPEIRFKEMTGAYRLPFTSFGPAIFARNLKSGNENLDDADRRDCDIVFNLETG